MPCMNFAFSLWSSLHSVGDLMFICGFCCLDSGVRGFRNLGSEFRGFHFSGRPIISIISELTNNWVLHRQIAELYHFPWQNYM